MKAWVRRGNLQRHQVGSVPMAAVQMVLRLSPPQPTEGRDVEWSPTSSPTPVSTPHAVGRLAGDPVGDVGVQPGHAPRDVTHWVPGEASYRVGGRHRRRRGCRRPFNVAALSWLCLLYTSPSPRDGLLSRMP